MSDQVVAGERCPICGKPSREGTRPFCSARCADVDLQRWFTGVYAIPVPDDENAGDEIGSDDDAGVPPGRVPTDRERS